MALLPVTSAWGSTWISPFGTTLPIPPRNMRKGGWTIWLMPIGNRPKAWAKPSTPPWSWLPCGISSSPGCPMCESASWKRASWPWLIFRRAPAIPGRMVPLPGSRSEGCCTDCSCAHWRNAGRRSRMVCNAVRPRLASADTTDEDVDDYAQVLLLFVSNYRDRPLPKAAAFQQAVQKRRARRPRLLLNVCRAIAAGRDADLEEGLRSSLEYFLELRPEESIIPEVKSEQAVSICGSSREFVSSGRAEPGLEAVALAAAPGRFADHITTLSHSVSKSRKKFRRTCYAKKGNWASGRPAKCICTFLGGRVSRRAAASSGSNGDPLPQSR